MKKLVVSTLLATLMGVAGAQSVSVYGIVDAGVRYDASANASKADRTKFLSGAQSTSRIGLKGSEDLGGGLTAKFQLESGISTADGTTSQNGSSGSVLFDRAAWVGLADSKLGEVQLGRNTTATFDFAAQGISDPLGQSLDGVSTPVGVASNSTALRVNQSITVVGATNSFKTTRADNMIKYTNTIKGVTVVGGYSAGGVSGELDQKSSYSLGAKTTVAGVTASAATFRAIDAASKDLTVNSYGLTSKLGNLTGTVGYHTIKTEAGYAAANLTTTATAATLFGGIAGVDAKVTNAGVKYQVTPKLSSTVAYYYGDYKNASNAGKLDSYVLFNQYDLSKRTNLYAEVDYTKAKGDLASGVSATNIGGVVGVRHTF